MNSKGLSVRVQTTKNQGSKALVVKNGLYFQQHKEVPDERRQETKISYGCFR
jgi:hypothetical protein